MRKTTKAIIILIALLVIGCGHQKGGQTIVAENDTEQVQASMEQQRIDTIASFLGHHLVLDDNVLQQIEEMASNDDFLSVEDEVLRTGDVRWGINVERESVCLISSVEPDDPKMLEVVKYLNEIYGNPYEYENGGLDIKWSSSKDPQDIFSPGCTLVHLRRIWSEEGGTCLIFY